MTQQHITVRRFYGRTQIDAKHVALNPVPQKKPGKRSALPAVAVAMVSLLSAACAAYLSLNH